jgi:site-specific DNA-cytosine methylase
MKTHIDLFTGLGGFSVAAESCGITTIAMCEIEPHCVEFLHKAWPGVTIHDDIRQLNVAIYSGAYLLTAGCPCQPASQAGKRRGSDDDRWLWPEALRILGEVRPTWALFENPPGIGSLAEYREYAPVDGEGCAVGNIGDVYSHTGAGHLYKILEEIEACGYSVQTVSIPACAVNAPHKRERYWIIARRMADTIENNVREAEAGWSSRENGITASRSVEIGYSGVGQADAGQSGREGCDAEQRGDGLCTKHSGGNVGNAQQGRCGTRPREAGEIYPWGTQPQTGERHATGHLAHPTEGGWDDFVWMPCADGKVRRAPDDTISMANGLPLELFEGLPEGEEAQPHRSLIAALGNSIVPEVARRIIQAMVDADNS